MDEADAIVLKQWFTRRDADAFNAILARYSGMVYATCLRILRDSSDAADVTQECFESLVTAVQPPDRHLGGWLHRVATNLSLKRVRSEQRRRSREAVFTASRDAHVEPTWSDIYERLDEAIAELPERYREPLVAYYLARRTQSDIARELGLTQSTVAYRISQGVERIGKALRKQGVIVPAAFATIIGANLAHAAPVPESVMTALGKLAIIQSAGGAVVKAATAAAARGAWYAAINVKSMAFVTVAFVVAGLVFVAAPHLFDRRAPAARNEDSGTLAEPQKLIVARANSRVRESRGSSAIRAGIAGNNKIVGRAGMSLAAAPDLKETIAGLRPSGRGRFLGTVKVREGGRPISGAMVRVTQTTPKDDQSSSVINIYGVPDPNAPSWETTTDATGEFELAHLPFGKYVVVAANESASACSRFVLDKGQPEQSDNFALMPCGSVAGFVRSEDGKAIPGALVIPQTSGASFTAINVPDANRTFSGPNGEFEMRYLPKGRVTIAVRATGFAALLTDAIDVGAQGLELTLKKGSGVSGRIVEAETGKPVPEIQVVVASRRIEIDVQAQRTDSEGHFSLEALADADYTIDVEHELLALVEVPQRFTIQDGAPVGDLEIRVAKGASITGRVYDADSKLPLAGLYVRTTVGERRIRRNVATDSDGVYRFDGLPAGQYRIERRWNAKLLGGREDGRTVSLGLGQALDNVDFPVKHALTLRGRVVDSSGKPLDNVTVDCVDANGDGETVQSTKNGTFENRGNAPHSSVMVTARKGTLAAGPIGPLAFADEDLSGVEVVMEKAASLSGDVVDAAGNALENIYIYVTGQGTAGAPDGSATDSLGRFKIDGLAAGAYTMRMQRADSFSSMSHVGESMVVSKGQDVTGLRLVFEEKAGAGISGRVTERSGKPIARAIVTAQEIGGAGGAGYTQSDGDGRYTITGLNEGSYRVLANHESYSHSERRDIVAGAANVDFVLEGRGAIDGHVVDAATGKPIAAFQMAQANGAVQQADAWTPNQWTSFSNSDGAFHIEKVEIGDTTLIAKAKGYAPTPILVPNVKGGATTPGVVLPLELGASIDGTVRNTAGQPVVGAQIQMGNEAYEMGEPSAALAMTDANGTFHLDSLAPRETTLIVTHADYVTASATVNVAAGRSTPASVELDGGGTITGTVCIGGKPQSGAQVIASSQPGSSQPARVTAVTDASGAFTLKKAPRGRVVVSASARMGLEPAGYRQAQRQVEVTAGKTTVTDFNLGGGTAAIEGVITMDGEPLSHAYISASVSGADTAYELLSGDVGAGGRYRLDGLPAGAVTLTAYDSSVQQTPRSRAVSLRTASGQCTHREIELNEGATLSGTVAGAGANDVVMVVALNGDVAVTEFNQSFFDSVRGRLIYQTRAQDGSYMMPGLESGHYTIVAVAVNPTSLVANAAYRFAAGAVDVNGVEVSLDLSIP